MQQDYYDFTWYRESGSSTFTVFNHTSCSVYVGQTLAMPADIDEQVFDVRWSNGTITEGARR